MAPMKIRIHPAIGIARLGNSPKEFFLGPEIPGVYPRVDKYRDSKMLLKRQGARFRLFEYYGKDNKRFREINAGDPRIKSIRWTVHLVNSKAAGRFFAGILHQDSRLRNEKHSRHSLVLDGKPATVEGTNQKRDICCEKFIHKKFPSPLRLGTLLTDRKGRLIVLGGHGQSGTLVHSPLDKEGDDFANHDNWYDDISDGPVVATILWKSGRRTTIRTRAWVLVAPPKYAPSLENVITLYDVLYQKALDEKLIKTADPLAPKAKPSFTKDIYPILRRAYEMRWVFARAQVGHEDELDLTRLRKSDFRKLQLRAKHIFDQFRRPADVPTKPGSGTGHMPYIWSDIFDMDTPDDDLHPVNATLTRHQYEVMQAWSTGHFISDWPRTRKIKRKITPAGLDRAALEACVGAAFFPGIETSFHIRDRFRYVEPFRLDHKTVKPGDVTQPMSLPWQTDFVDCSDGDSPLVWWPAQRPVDVRSGPEKDPERWARDFQAGTEDVDPEGMVRDWWRLGLLKRSLGGVFEAHRVNRLRAQKRKRS
jgi:hypothetical protein